MRIRRARIADVPILTSMNASIFRDKNVAQVRRVFASALKSLPSACLVAEEGGEIVGAIIAERRLAFVPRAAFITSFFVKTAWRGKGVGKMLFEKCLAGMKKAGMKSITLTVEPKNKKALALYKKSGFRQFRLLMLREF